eukprot:m.18159 g.18159  ORF g.18159 m.18159 type:complete len:545 (+) comp9546_c0_seq1:428-2062(+)
MSASTGYFNHFAEDGAWDEEAEVSRMREDAGRGVAEAQYLLGWHFMVGDQTPYGPPHDLTEAFRWFRKGAEQGHAEAQLHLGNCYEYGDGVARDASQAFTWYRKAAEQGNGLAQANLARFYEHGFAVDKDEAEAVEWYRKAIEDGVGVKEDLERLENKIRAEQAEKRRLAAEAERRRQEERRRRQEHEERRKREAAQCAKAPSVPAPWIKQWNDKHDRVVYLNPDTGKTVMTVADVVAAIAQAEERARAEAARARQAAEAKWVRHVGFPEDEALAALREAGGNKERATHLLIDRALGRDLDSGDDDGSGGADAAVKSASRVAMHDDDHPPTAFDHAEWVRLRDRLYYAHRETGDRRAAVTHKVAKAMNVLQEDYKTRFVSVGLKGAQIAELLAVSSKSFIGHSMSDRTSLNDYIKELQKRGDIDRTLSKHLHTLRVLGNNARHEYTPPFTAPDKPKVADAVYAVAKFMERKLLPAAGEGVAADCAGASGGGLLAQVEAIREALSIVTPARRMRDVVTEARDLLGLDGTGTVPDQVAAIVAFLGL